MRRDVSFYFGEIEEDIESIMSLVDIYIDYYMNNNGKSKAIDLNKLKSDLIRITGEINIIKQQLNNYIKIGIPNPKNGKKTIPFLYRIPILKSLDELGGSADNSDVIKLVYDKMKVILNKIDHQRVKTGAIRWENTTRWCRQSLKEEGLLKSNSPHGIWEISYEGRKYLEREYDNWVDRIKKIKENQDNDNNVNKY